MRLFPRLLNALFALWFAVLAGDPGTLHTCAMHSGGHGGSHVVSASHHAGMTHDASAPAPDSAVPCTCMGHCCAMSAAADVPAVASIHVAEVLAVHRHALAEPSAVAPASPGLRLPFANGPPRA